jgi:P27 family predicted phage terminase small subunit
MAPELTRLKFLRETDLSAFSRYCEHLARWWALTKELRKEGETYETQSAHGNMLRVNPKFVVRERIEKRLEPLEDRFGLTPGARMQIMQRLAVVPPLPVGGLFDDDKDKPAGQAPVTPASPLGLLNRGSSAVN